MSITKKYAPFPISKIDPNSELVTDIYIKLKEKYIKFKQKGDSISAQKLNLFLSKNVKFLYIAIDQLQMFIDKMNAEKEINMRSLIDELGSEYKEIVESREELKEKIYETFADENVSSESVMLIQGMVTSVVEKVVNDEIPAKMLTKLLKLNNTIADHSVNVANLSVFFAMINGHGHQYVLENIYMGALFHDYGKIKIPAELLENPEHPKYVHAIQEHPLRGKKMISNLENIPPQVLTIIEQHHEQYNGKGFPAGIKGKDIYELARIVSIANVFEHTLTDNKNRPSQMYKVAWKVLDYDRGIRFDPNLTPRIIDAIKLGFKNLKN